MNLTVSNMYFKLLHVDICVGVLSINSLCIFKEEFNVFQFVSSDEHKVILVLITEHFNYLVVNGMKLL